MTPAPTVGVTQYASLGELNRLVSDVCDLNSKLILLVGPSNGGKTRLLRQLGAKLSIEPLNVGQELGRRLAATPNNKRGFSASDMLREIADRERTEDPLLLDNIELLFEPSLKINPLDLVRRLAHSKRVVAVWPGELRGDRLIYADISHPEHRDYSRDGVVVLEI
ncbi:MAG: BREX-3 system P-loop-containing protein BrxF [Rhodanobacteraceae bacterium]|nr:BREX-3 system P-loop-containing protein BrxF [Rhodanobacteraceae bacterium]